MSKRRKEMEKRMIAINEKGGKYMIIQSNEIMMITMIAVYNYMNQACYIPSYIPSRKKNKIW